jgi:hypothetical protein
MSPVAKEDEVTSKVWGQERGSPQLLITAFQSLCDLVCTKLGSPVILVF